MLKAHKLVLPLLFLSLFGCTEPSSLTDQVLLEDASAGQLSAVQGRVMTDNDAAFQSKLGMIEGAQRSIDVAYYIFSDDYSSSYLTMALINAARRGVTVRLLVDYQTNYKLLDLFSMMEKLGDEGKGNLSIRFYNRPTKNIIQDAVYMTMGCGRELAPNTASENCSKEKFAIIDKLFVDETIDGRPVARRNISNLNVGGSGLFLSGLYSKRGDIMAVAVEQGQGIDASKLEQGGTQTTPKEKENLKKLAKVYWTSKTGSVFKRLEAKANLYLVFSLYGKKLNPIYNTFTSLVPAEKQFSDEAKLDWDHITDFLHHKLLLVDQTKLQMGGRNVGDSYHMHPNALTAKYVFMDTDVYVELDRGGDAVTRAFDKLWNFDAMVATLAEVRQHAPNELIANLDIYREVQAACGKGGKINDACVDGEFPLRARDLATRMNVHAQAMEKKAKIYRTQYLPTVPTVQGTAFTIDAGAILTFLENLPFSKDAVPLQRHYGASVGQEAAAGKYIHDVWLKSLPSVCRLATKDISKQVILHSAYFYPPANLTYALSRMVNGDLDCSNVTVTVLTNSIETTDLNIVNLMARHALKAFTEFYEKSGDPVRRATFQYYEYQMPPPPRPNLSLHSKVSVFGDDIVIGSANADVRSFMMDSNDVMFIRRAPILNKAYIAFVQNILTDGQRVKRLNDYFSKTPRNVMVQEDLAILHSLLIKYHADEHLNRQERTELERRFVEVLDDAYRYTGDSISVTNTATKRREQQNTFNDFFKPI